MSLHDSHTKPQANDRELEMLRAQVDSLEKAQLRAEVKVDIFQHRNIELGNQIVTLQRMLAEAQKRNKDLENPKSAGRYSTLGWRGKIIYCLRKWKRPLRLKEIIAELEIMEADGLRYQGENFISVVLAKAVKLKALHIEKVSGTRGAFYALPEWLDENAQLPTKMKRAML